MSIVITEITRDCVGAIEQWEAQLALAQAEIKRLRAELATAQKRLSAVETERQERVDASARAFVQGAEWWLFHSTGATMFGQERREAEAEAERRGYPFATGMEKALLMRLEEAADQLAAAQEEIERLRENNRSTRVAIESRHHVNE